MPAHLPLTAQDISKITNLFGFTVSLEPADAFFDGERINHVNVDTIDPNGLASKVLDHEWMKGKTQSTGLNEIKIVWRDEDKWRCLHVPSIMRATQEIFTASPSDLLEIRTRPDQDVYVFFLDTCGATSLSIMHPPFAFEILKSRWKDAESSDSYVRACAIVQEAKQEVKESMTLTDIQQFRDFFNGMHQSFIEAKHSEIGFDTPEAIQVIRLAPPERVPIPQKVEGKWIVAGYQGYCMEFLFDAEGNYLGAGIGD